MASGAILAVVQSPGEKHMPWILEKKTHRFLGLKIVSEVFFKKKEELWGEKKNCFGSCNLKLWSYLFIYFFSK